MSKWSTRQIATAAIIAALSTVMSLLTTPLWCLVL